MASCYVKCNLKNSFYANSSPFFTVMGQFLVILSINFIIYNNILKTLFLLPSSLAISLDFPFLKNRCFVLFFNPSLSLLPSFSFPTHVLSRLERLLFFNSNYWSNEVKNKWHLYYANMIYPTANESPLVAFLSPGKFICPPKAHTEVGRNKF